MKKLNNTSTITLRGNDAAAFPLFSECQGVNADLEFKWFAEFSASCCMISIPELCIQARPGTVANRVYEVFKHIILDWEEEADRLHYLHVIVMR